MSSLDEKLQIVAFSTNDTYQTPNDIINLFLEEQNHVILKKTRNAIAFTTSLNNSSKSTKIMICSVLNLGREYTGITEVNCYIIFVDLSKENSKEKFESILTYMKDYCDLSKKIFILGMINSNNTEENKLVKKEEIIKSAQNSETTYEYKEINLSNTKEISNTIMNILIYSSKNSINGEVVEEEKEEGHSGSCEIF